MDQLTISFGVLNAFPDPADIQFAGEWYFLNHVSSPLLAFDHDKGVFAPLLAESWSINSSTYRLVLSPEARFSDGTKITSNDIAATIKLQLVRKTASHFPLWKTIKGGDRLTSVQDDCPGIRIVDDRTVDVELVDRSESFFLFLSSPESGIWSADDIGAGSKWNGRPKRYSGAYKVDGEDKDGSYILAANSYSPIQKAYPSSPARILVKKIGRSAMEDGVVDGSVDLFIGDFIPHNKYEWDKVSNVKTHNTTPSTIIYFYSLTKNPEKAIGQDLLQTLWKKVDQEDLFTANTFLPFSPKNSLPAEDFLPALPTKSKPKLKILTFDQYFTDPFLADLKNRAAEAGIDLEFDRAPMSVVGAEYDKPSGMWDYLLASYVASERYPAVQLRFIAGPYLADADMRDADRPDHNEARSTALRAVQKKLLTDQRVVPVYFVRTHIVYRDKLDLGNQPTTDAEIHLWKVTEPSK